MKKSRLGNDLKNAMAEALEHAEGEPTDGTRLTSVEVISSTGSLDAFFAERSRLIADGLLDDLLIERDSGKFEREDPLR